MKIKKIQIKGFKRFYDLTIDLGECPKRIVALVGPNGCGKSSIFDAMMYEYNSFKTCGAYSKKTQDYKYCSLSGIDNISYENIIMEFDKGNFAHVNDLRDKIGKPDTLISFRGPYRYNSGLDIKQVEAVSSISDNDYGASNTSSIDDKMPDNYKRLNNKFNKYMYDKDKKPSEALKEIIGELNKSITKCLNLEITNIGDIGASKGTLYFKKNDSPREFDFNVLSSGEKEVIDILLDLYLRKDDYDDTIFLIDEPELHINTSIQRKLFNEINNLIGDNCQIWIATHSIGFLRALQEDFKNQSQIINFNENNNWSSESYILKPEEMTRNMWSKLFETALDDLTNLVSPRKIIYCEGKDKPNSNMEEEGLDATVFNTIFNNKYPDVLFVSSGGNTELNQRSDIAILILKKVFKDLEILVLKDRDMASGKNTNESSRQLYLDNNSQNHRVLKRYEIENYLYDKSVLKLFCLDNNLIFSEEDYDSFVKDIVNQNLKDATGTIKNICNLSVPISADKFKKNLSKYITEDMEIYKELEEIIFERK